ncbi:hypothetical protein GCM10010112_86390 [Actinoplanes lobatus]|nr:hypothetical protein GCM10010112_86390 [Actinoplanes lobatus]
MRGCPTDLRPAGAAQAGAGSKRAPTGRNGPDQAGRGHAYKKGAGSEARTSTTNDLQGRKLARYSVGLRVVSWRKAELKADSEV